MPRRLLPLLAATAAAASLALAGSAGAMGVQKLNGTVGPGFTISLKDAKGKPVKTLKAGRYTFVIQDKASIHNFVLEQQKGGTFEKQLTAVPFVGKKTVTLMLKKGTWKYYCAPHAATMRGFFTVK